ncbi:GntR family transcriptional regulator [Heliorestis acidaminivorans]|uniref:GntR family transcriptional regulator n=1 Tax=Heliorestis acidaminivorans TaxID=553427 RepID=A0A6I0F7R9_9FIRM|nr:GntR family transcriptional regulator [Heliorestis acidaminivorans]KAB2953443.1 GntR family transcriptional regulator [Heliorestis acidaminivorans]
MIELDLRSGLPIFEQLVNNFKELIIREVLAPDEQLPSVRTLASQLTVNPNTIQKAYKELERQGFIYSVKGKGSFVAPLTDQVNREKQEALKKELQKITVEAIYLGLTQEEICQWVIEVATNLREGDSND